MKTERNLTNFVGFKSKKENCLLPKVEKSRNKAIGFTSTKVPNQMNTARVRPNQGFDTISDRSSLVKRTLKRKNSRISRENDDYTSLHKYNEDLTSHTRKGHGTRSGLSKQSTKLMNNIEIEESFFRSI